MGSNILRLKRTDNLQHLLVQVSQTHPSRPLDLKLIATDHEHLYHGNISETNIKSLQANNFAGSLQEWKDILNYILLHQKSNTNDFSNLETVAAGSGKSVNITIRNNVEGITQRLGSISLTQDDEKEEVSPFEWVDEAVANGDTLRTQLEVLQASVSEQQDQVAKLTKQLDELVQAKKEHEEQLLQKFATLLNAKKLKIRDQQRLLAGAKIDPKVGEAVSQARAGRSATGRASGKSRKGKRKVDDAGSPEELEDEEDRMNGNAEEDGDEDRQQETPERSDAEATDDELGAAIDTTARDGRNSARLNDDAMSIDDPPPRQKSPAQKPVSQSTRSAKAKAPPPPEDEDDETDDEL